MVELRTKDEIREAVRERYAAAARSVGAEDAGCCGSAESSCGCSAPVEGTPEVFGAELYASEDREALPDAARLASLGCGNPTAVADLRDG